jgi:hypothetical protein
MKGRLMSATTKKLQRGLGLLLLAAGSLASVSCDDPTGDGDGGVFNDVLNQCGVTCPGEGKGVAAGNASVSGYGPIDSFFRSVINYKTTAVGAAAQIDLELEGIKQLFGITEAELKGKTLGQAISAKIQAQAEIVVKSTPAQCKVDASIAAEVSAKCQAAADCQINPGMTSFNCMGTCDVEVEAKAQCNAQAKVECQVTAPDFECKGSCSGSCEVMTPVVDCNAGCTGMCSGTCTLDAPTLTCAGRCSGQCDGTCSVALSADGTCAGTCSGSCSAGCEVNAGGAKCEGKCTGMCSAGCQVSGQAALTCNGKCSGTCSYDPGMANCDARASVHCETSGSAAAMCTGSCQGEFEPPSASCDASASCQASAKAEARFQVKCTPPRVEVSVKVKANATVSQAQIDFWIAELGARLPRISASVGRAKVVDTAGDELNSDGKAAVNDTIGVVGKGKLGLLASAKVLTCAPAGVRESAKVVAEAKGVLDVSVKNASSVAAAFGMLM